jgi:hypothetical protein
MRAPRNFCGAAAQAGSTKKVRENRHAWRFVVVLTGFPHAAQSSPKCAKRRELRRNRSAAGGPSAAR